MSGSFPLLQTMLKNMSQMLGPNCKPLLLDDLHFRAQASKSLIAGLFLSTCDSDMLI